MDFGKTFPDFRVVFWLLEPRLSAKEFWHTIRFQRFNVTFCQLSTGLGENMEKN